MNDPGEPDRDRAPLFGRWAPWYALLVVELIAVIAFCGWLAAQRG